MRLRRIYVNNFRGMRKFEVKFEDASDNVILGKNGVGKSTLRNVLELMKAIACGENSVEKLLSPKDFSFSNANEPLRIELECTVNGDCTIGVRPSAVPWITRVRSTRRSAFPKR